MIGRLVAYILGVLGFKKYVINDEWFRNKYIASSNCWGELLDSIRINDMAMITRKIDNLRISLDILSQHMVTDVIRYHREAYELNGRLYLSYELNCDELSLSTINIEAPSYILDIDEYREFMSGLMIRREIMHRDINLMIVDDTTKEILSNMNDRTYDTLYGYISSYRAQYVKIKERE